MGSDNKTPSLNLHLYDNTRSPRQLVMAAYKVESPTNNTAETLDENEEIKGGGFKAMSPLRLATFILSILMSIVSTSVFLWGVPCDSNPCTAQRLNETVSLYNSSTVTSYGGGEDIFANITAPTY